MFQWDKCGLNARPANYKSAALTSELLSLRQFYLFKLLIYCKNISNCFSANFLLYFFIFYQFCAPHQVRQSGGARILNGSASFINAYSTSISQVYAQLSPGKRQILSEFYFLCPVAGSISQAEIKSPYKKGSVCSNKEYIYNMSLQQRQELSQLEKYSL